MHFSFTSLPIHVTVPITFHYFNSPNLGLCINFSALNISLFSFTQLRVWIYQYMLYSLLLKPSFSYFVYIFYALFVYFFQFKPLTFYFLLFCLLNLRFAFFFLCLIYIIFKHVTRFYLAKTQLQSYDIRLFCL